MKIPTSYKAAIAALLVLIAIICPQLAHSGISHVHRLAAYGPLLPIREASTSMGSIRGVGIIMAILRAMAR
jgi:hypothetical protein